MSRSHKMQKSRHTLLYYIGLVILLTCVACDHKTVYSQYESVAISGWEKNDMLSFSTPPIQQTGDFQEKIGLRISGLYPFMGLTLIIDQTKLPSMETERDTLNCDLIDHNGNAKGPGISNYQYEIALKTIALNEGESLHIDIRHDMKREILPGVSDVGIILTRK